MNDIKTIIKKIEDMAKESSGDVTEVQHAIDFSVQDLIEAHLERIAVALEAIARNFEPHATGLR